MEKIVDFSGLLRKNGIPVSIRSTYTGQQVQELIGEDDPYFKNALASVYIKEHKHGETFDRLFDEFFHGSNENDDGKYEVESSETHKKSVCQLKAPKNGLFQTGKMILIIRHGNYSNEKNYHPPLDEYSKTPNEA
jgi:uncharacterized protein with von Willebrand factor type A (vWA) domain